MSAAASLTRKVEFEVFVSHFFRGHFKEIDIAKLLSRLNYVMWEVSRMSVDRRQKKVLSIKILMNR